MTWSDVREFLLRAKQIALLIWDQVRKFLLWAARIALYPILLALRVLARLLSVLATIVPIVLPIAAVPWLRARWPEFDAIEQYPIPQPIVEAVGFLVAAGLFAWVFQILVKHAVSAFDKFWTSVRRVGWKTYGGRNRWFPGCEIKMSVAVTWRLNVKRSMKQVWYSSKVVWRLVVTVLAVVVLSLAAYPLLQRPVQTVNQYVAVVDTDQDTAGLLKLYMHSGALFSLVHAKDAQPKEGQGICLGDPQQAWLEQFRIAIANCVKEGGGGTERPDDPLVFKVTAYASIAPMHLGGNTSESAKLNCKVANWRAQAVGAFLADPESKEYEKQWHCDHVGNRFNKLPSECGGDELNSHYDGKDADGNEIRVDVHRWATPEQMFDGRPVDDGTPKQRRFAVEILNRVVHIELPKGFCGKDPP